MPHTNDSESCAGSMWDRKKMNEVTTMGRDTKKNQKQASWNRQEVTMWKAGHHC